ncbi:MAG: DUF2244 domain-containing protein [Pseudomonadota bacterium]
MTPHRPQEVSAISNQDGARPEGTDDAPILRLTLWPYRSLDPRTLPFIMIATTIALAIPLIPALGSDAVYVLGGFALFDFLLLFGLIALTYRSGRVREIVSLWPDRLRVERIEPNGASKCWEAHPHWVRVDLMETRRIKDYLVLSASGRSIELGAFLTPGERRALAGQLRDAFRDAARHSRSPAR